MLSMEATDLAVKIGQTFNGPPIDVWEEELAHLDAGRAGTAIVRARREHNNRWLSIAQFLEFYRGVNTDDASTRPPECGDCDNTGWMKAPDIVHHPGEDHERHDSAVKPCRCPIGKQASQSAVWKYRTPEEAA